MDDEPRTVADEEALPCGRELAQVWERWEAGERDPHVDDCPYCTDAVAALRALEGVVAQARVAEPPEQASQAATLAGRIMDVVRLELRPGRTLPLGDEDEDAWIVEAAAARTIRAAVETLPGVRAGSCRIDIAPLGADRGRPAPVVPSGRLPRGPVRVRVEIQVALSWNLRDVADRARHRVLAAADTDLGMRVTEIDVRIADIIDDDGAEDGGVGDGVEGERR
ncbi:hypothetical protein CP970_08465 [Streptomyces kanamyceticus]|uniref:Asp23/Gls24 family envelope stress response protein n=2 Tax=Streptomyces kanamyceticus TaxID=1967 RepID=A0A5J6GTR3_STRKN|nr:hypothetical protein CP970_08465 [Streptomyces kanamyceticus]